MASLIQFLRIVDCSNTHTLRKVRSHCFPATSSQSLIRRISALRGAEEAQETEEAEGARRTSGG
ncbi:hypothetical protein JOB18_015816 [Solea senegalensis]|uniref:Uncharacterized protein n=1 Tax=Solea senegalensis TaxID=28829 RepID=A0AAV6RL73_SOLSE|nr:hypothetical protein JOB18_015816 [Solea senegalensis]